MYNTAGRQAVCISCSIPHSHSPALNLTLSVPTLLLSSLSLHLPHVRLPIFILAPLLLHRPVRAPPGSHPSVEALLGETAASAQQVNIEEDEVMLKEVIVTLSLTP